MKTKIRVGIPRALLYYRYSVLWQSFFSNLGCQVVVSPETNKEIIDTGIKNSVDEACLSSKIYLGHVSYLADKCDYLLVPRICDYGNGNKVCVKFNGVYDIVKNLYPNIKILNYNIEKAKGKYQFWGFIKIGLKLNKNIFKIVNSYFNSLRKQQECDNNNYEYQSNIEKKMTKKVLIVSHPYNIYDKYLGQTITDYLTNSNIDILYADRLSRKKSIAYSKELSKTLYWLYSKELIGAINYYKNNISGIIFLSTFPCGVDSLVNELMLRKITDLPKLNIIIDESSNEVGLMTRLESFVDIIKGDI